jgi:hypothetical protein
MFASVIKGAFRELPEDFFNQKFWAFGLYLVNILKG